MTSEGQCVPLPVQVMRPAECSLMVQLDGQSLHSTLNTTAPQYNKKWSGWRNSAFFGKFCSVPWDLQQTAWLAEMMGRCCPTLREHSDDFCPFLAHWVSTWCCVNICSVSGSTVVPRVDALSGSHGCSYDLHKGGPRW